MELTVEQALQQGLKAHKQAKLKDAERIYRAILRQRPKQPEANHNLGVIAVSANKVEAALPLLKTALDGNPGIEQFWLSYLDALIKVDQFEDARQALVQAKKHGVGQQKLDLLEKQFREKIQPDGVKSTTQEKALKHKGKRKNLAKVRRGKGKKGKINTNINPPDAELQKLMLLYQKGRLDHAETLAQSLTKRFPKHPFPWKVLGVLLQNSGRFLEAENANQKLVELTPQDAEAHSNLGIALKELGRLEEAEISLRQAIALHTGNARIHSNYGNTLKALGKLGEAEAIYRKAIALEPDQPECHNNLGATLRELTRLDEAEESYRLAISLKPDYVEAHNNLGVLLQDLGRLDEAEASYKQAIAFNPDYADAHCNLAFTLQQLGRLDGAEESYRLAISLKPDYAEAHGNFGITLKEQGRLTEAEASYRQAIALRPNYAEPYNNLGVMLQELGRLDEAEASYKQALAIEPEHALANSNLTRVLFVKGDKVSALRSIEKAYSVDPQSKENRLLKTMAGMREFHEENKDSGFAESNCTVAEGLRSNPVILDRVVDPALIEFLYGMRSRAMEETEATDARFGNGICSLDFSLFDDNSAIVQSLADDLKRIMMEEVKSDIYIYDSFFNILGAGGGTTPHAHLTQIDEDLAYLGKRKYSLVYYLCVGDQNCSEPGTLKLYGPDEDILPREGMITIIPGSRKHSAVYGGETDRVMVGVNFYRLS